MAKPMAFWSVNALPTIAGGQALAERAENCGESITASRLHTARYAIRATKPRWGASHGYSAQPIAEPASPRAATRRLPRR